MDDLPDIQGLSQQIATLHLSGDLILEQPVGKHIRRATIAQIMNAPPSKNSHLMLGGRECKYVELVANVAAVTRAGARIDFTLDDGFGRIDAWLPREAADIPSQAETISSLRPFDYAHIEGKVNKSAASPQVSFQIISVRRVQSGYEIFLHLLQVLSSIDQTIKVEQILDFTRLELSCCESAQTTIKASSTAKVVPTSDEPQEPLPPAPATSAYASTPKKGQPKGKTRTQTGPSKSTSARPKPPAAGQQQHRDLRQLRDHILQYFRNNFRAATTGKGIAIHDQVLSHLIVEDGMDDLTTDEFREAIEHLLAEGFIYSTIDEFHYALQI